MARLVLGGGGKAAHGLRWGQLRGRKLGWVGRRSAAPAGSRLRGALWERGFPPETSRAARLPSALPRRDPREGRKEGRRKGRREGRRGGREGGREEGRKQVSPASPTGGARLSPASSAKSGSWERPQGCPRNWVFLRRRQGAGCAATAARLPSPARREAIPEGGFPTDPNRDSAEVPEKKRPAACGFVKDAATSAWQNWPRRRIVRQYFNNSAFQSLSHAFMFLRLCGESSGCK